MSVRMALAKLCACACGGAVIGGGGVYAVERATQPSVVQQYTVAKKRVVRKGPVAGVTRKKLVRRVTTTTTVTKPEVVVV